MSNNNNNNNDNEIANNNEEISDNNANNGEIAANSNTAAPYSSIMARLSPYAGDLEEEEEDANTPGELQLFVEDDSKVAPNNRFAYCLMLGKHNVPDFDIDEFIDLAGRAGKKSAVRITKQMALSEVKRRNPRTKFNKNNAKLDSLLNMILPLDEETDIAYITKKVAEMKATLLTTIAEKEGDAAPAAYLTPLDRLRWVGLHQRDDVLALFQKSQEAPTREQLDAGETPSVTSS